jgi:hypothetical protein
MLRILNIIPKLPKDIEKAIVPIIKKNTNPFRINGEALKVDLTLLLRTTNEKAKRIKFSIAAKKEGILLISINVGRYKKVNIFNGKG